MYAIVLIWDIVGIVTMVKNIRVAHQWSCYAQIQGRALFPSLLGCYEVSYLFLVPYHITASLSRIQQYGGMYVLVKQMV